MAVVGGVVGVVVVVVAHSVWHVSCCFVCLNSHVVFFYVIGGKLLFRLLDLVVDVFMWLVVWLLLSLCSCGSEHSERYVSWRCFYILHIQKVAKYRPS